MTDLLQEASQAVSSASFYLLDSLSENYQLGLQVFVYDTQASFFVAKIIHLLVDPLNNSNLMDDMLLKG